MKDPFVWRFVFSYWWLRRKLQTGSALQQGTHSHLGIAEYLLQPHSAGLRLCYRTLHVTSRALQGDCASPYPLPSLCHSSQVHLELCNTGEESRGIPWLLVERDETAIEMRWMAQWAADSVFSPCSKLLPAAVYAGYSALQGVEFLMNIFLSRGFHCRTGRAEQSSASVTSQAEVWFFLCISYFLHPLSLTSNTKAAVSRSYLFLPWTLLRCKTSAAFWLIPKPCWWCV